jgi:hypothetical protein
VNGALETAVIALSLNAAASTAALVYVVRRLAAWPKPPAPQQPAGQTRWRGQPEASAPDGEHAGSTNGTSPSGGAL